MTALALTDPGSAALARGDARLAVDAASCRHCAQPCPRGQAFCCAGCAAAHQMIQRLGLGDYYERVRDAAALPPRPQAAERGDLLRHVVTDASGAHSLTMAVEGLQCGACVWLIETVLGREPDVLRGRINMTTRRLHLVWQGDGERGGALVARIEALGYRLVPYQARALAAAVEPRPRLAGSRRPM